MGQHIQLFASKSITLESAKVWSDLKAEELLRYANDAEKTIVAVVETEMAKIKNSIDHLDHWASWGGSACFPFIAYETHLIDNALVKRAEMAGSDFRSKQVAANPESWYAQHDWVNDAMVKFLRSHIGYVIWCDPDL